MDTQFDLFKLEMILKSGKAGARDEATIYVLEHSTDTKECLKVAGIWQKYAHSVPEWVQGAVDQRVDWIRQNQQSKAHELRLAADWVATKRSDRRKAAYRCQNPWVLIRKDGAKAVAYEEGQLKELMAKGYVVTKGKVPA